MLINIRNRNLKVTTTCTNLTKTKYNKIRYKLDSFLCEYFELFIEEQYERLKENNRFTYLENKELEIEDLTKLIMFEFEDEVDVDYPINCLDKVCIYSTDDVTGYIFYEFIEISKYKIIVKVTDVIEF